MSTPPTSPTPSQHDESLDSGSSSPIEMTQWTKSNILIDLNPLNYESDYRVMIENLSRSPLAAPLTRTPPAQFPCRILELSLEKVQDISKQGQEPWIRVQMMHNREECISREHFLAVIGVVDNPADFMVVPPTDDSFNQLLSNNGYVGIYMPKSFKKAKVTGVWSLFIHLMWKGFSGKYGGADSVSREWVNLAFSIYNNRMNVVDIPGLLWNDFIRFYNRRGKRLSSPRFWALGLNQLYVYHVCLQTHPTPRTTHVRYSSQQLLLSSEHLRATDPTNTSVPAQAVETAQTKPQTETSHLSTPKKRVKIMAHKKTKRKAVSAPPSHNAKRSKAVGSSSKGPKISLKPDSGLLPTSPHPIPSAAEGISKSFAHINRESPPNPSTSSQKDWTDVEHRSLKPPGSYSRVIFELLYCHFTLT